MHTTFAYFEYLNTDWLQHARSVRCSPAKMCVVDAQGNKKWKKKKKKKDVCSFWIGI